MIQQNSFSSKMMAAGFAAALSSCSPQVTQETPPTCTMPELDIAADHFLKVLIADDFEAAATLHPNKELISYAFATPDGIAPIRAMNNADTLMSARYGAYEDGQLVLFIQQGKLPLAKDNEYLASEKFKSFYVCHFTCSNTWKISPENTCFEETGMPFHGDY